MSLGEELVFPGMIEKGLTKREWLAGTVLAGYLALQSHPSCMDEPTPEEAAKRCLRYVDALLAELESSHA